MVILFEVQDRVSYTRTNIGCFQGCGNSLRVIPDQATYIKIMKYINLRNTKCVIFGLRHVQKVDKVLQITFHHHQFNKKMVRVKNTF